jgi:hypothetical protein
LSERARLILDSTRASIAGNDVFPQWSINGSKQKNIKMYRATVIAILLCYCGVADAYGSLRCKGKIIEAGATRATVLALCGAPDLHVTEHAPVRAGSVLGGSRFIGIALDEQWVYDRGFGKFAAVLIFFDGRIQQVDYLPYRSEGSD